MAAPRTPQDRRPPAAKVPARTPATFVDIVTADAPERTAETLFAIDGVRYDMFVPVPANMALKALDRMVEQGESAAMMWLLREVIGQEGYEALRDCDAVSTEQLAAILDKLQQMVMGELEELGKA